VKKEMLHSERYPNMIFPECVELALTEDGDNIKFYTKIIMVVLYQL